MKELWDRFTAWLSGWPESKEKKLREYVYLFEEEEAKRAVKPKIKPKRIKGLNPKKKKGKKQGNIQ